MRVSFHGVRGSFPCIADGNRRYGGNTASVSLHVAGEPPILLDLGTGVPHLDTAAAWPGPFRAAVFLTHLHLDHVQGLPFFPPVHQEGTVLDVYGPCQDTGSLHDAVAALVGPPYFPVPLDDALGTIRFHEVTSDDVAVGGAKVRARPVPHPGPTVGYRIEWDGASVAYVSDHQAPPGLDTVDDAVLELCEGVDLLIHEAQYTQAEFDERPDWGHCTGEYAALVARLAGARRLCLFHHEPWRTDDDLDAVVEQLRGELAGTAVEEVMAAAERTTIDVRP